MPQIHVISGEKKGMKLAIPGGEWLRPTLARVKKTVFDVLGKSTKGTVVADIFAGTGNIGIEALSMGALHVIFVESEKLACNLLKKNLDKLKFDESSYTIVHRDALKALDHPVFSSCKLDLIFIDPPYRINAVKIREIIDSILAKDILKQEGEIIFFMLNKRMHEFEFKDFKITWQKNIGITTLTFLRKKDESESGISGDV
jgi:16S rRNA (guanine(966)-N(2))-methyltransferase RsmD